MDKQCKLQRILFHIPGNGLIELPLVDESIREIQDAINAKLRELLDSVDGQHRLVGLSFQFLNIRERMSNPNGDKMVIRINALRAPICQELNQPNNSPA